MGDEASWIWDIFGIKRRRELVVKYISLNLKGVAFTITITRVTILTVISTFIVVKTWYYGSNSVITEVNIRLKLSLSLSGCFAS